MKPFPLLHPLQHDGTTRRRRMAESLQPTYAPVDERSVADLILYAREYAQLLAYYDTENRPAGNWTALMTGDVSILAAVLYKSIDPTAEKAAFSAQADQLRKAARTDRAAILNTVLVSLVPQASRLLEWQQQVAQGLSLRATLDRLVPSVAYPALSQLLAYLRAARNEGFLEAEIEVELLEATWPSDDFLYGFDPLVSLENPDPASVEREIVQLNGIFRALHQVAAAVATQAPAFLEETLTAYPEHEPHIALFLAFVQLMAIPQENLNTLTGRHLDFYYREVLALDNFPEIPDQVHLVMELAQGFTEGLIAKDFRFLDGKDDLGMDVYFTPNEELVVNGAAIDPENGLKSLFLTKGSANTKPALGSPYEIQNLFAAPVANDPAANTPSTDGKWSPLGSEQAPAGRVGFVVSSPMLLLGEGNRKLEICFHVENFGVVLDTYGLSTVRSELETNVQVFLSGEKAWIPVASKTVEILQLTAASAETEAVHCLKYTLSLTPEDPSVVVYHSKLVGLEPIPDALTAKYPVACFLLDNFGISVLKDLDLSLAGDLTQKGFDANRRYLEGEITVAKSATTGAFEIFETKGQPIGIDYTSAALVWEDVTQKLSSPVAWSGTLAAGSFSEKDGNTYRANVTIATSQVPDPIIDTTTTPPTINKELQIWRELDGSSGDFDPEENYGKAILVQEGQEVYVSNQAIVPISPNKAPSVWKPVPSGDTLSSFNQTDHLFCAFQGLVFQLNVASTTEKPNLAAGGTNQANVWEELTTISQAPKSEYVLNEQVYEGSLDKLFKLINNDNSLNRKTNRPPVLSGDNLWQEITAFNPAVTYGPKPGINQPAFASYGGLLYEAHFVFNQENYKGTAVSNDSTLNPGKFIAGQAIKPWVRIYPYVAAAFVKGAVLSVAKPVNIGITTLIFTYYFVASRDVPATDAPESAGSGWVELGHDVFLNVFADGWNANTNYQAGSVVTGPDNVPYVAYISNKGIQPNAAQNIPLWSQATSTTYGQTQDYVAGSVVDFNSKIYYSRYNSTNIPPDKSAVSDIWQNRTEYRGTYAATTAYAKNQIIKYTSPLGFYQASTSVQGIDPTNQTTIWEKKTVNETYSPIVNTYQKDDLLTWKGKFYYALIVPTGYAPSVNFGPTAPWEKLGFAGPFSEKQNYTTGNLVAFNGNFYQCQFANKEIHPSLGQTALEVVPFSFDQYQSGQFYPAGTYLSAASSGSMDTGSVFRATTNTQLVAPASGTKVWVQNPIQIKAYLAGSTSPAGAYIEHNGSLYRQLSISPAEEPISASTDWMLVGTIRQHNPNIPWYANMHARDTKGNVFRATQNMVAQKSLSDVDEPSGDPLWEQVSGSYPYKYLLPTRLNRLDLSVEVTNMRNLLLENDQGVIVPGKPFNPFGTQPVPNSRFYIGSNEVFAKSPTSLTLRATWGNLPPEVSGKEAFTALYDTYGNSISPQNSTFTVSGYLLNENSWTSISGFTNETLFVNLPGTTLVQDKQWNITAETGLFARKPDLDPFTSLRSNLQRGFMAFQLNHDFYHQRYAVALAEAALHKDPIPSAPYTPLINSFSLDYTSSESIIFQDKTKGDLKGIFEQFFYLYPFGWADFLPVEPSLDDGVSTLTSQSLVPVWNGQKGDATGNPVIAIQEQGLPTRVEQTAYGSLFIGLSGVKAPQMLTLLIQVAESSENPDRNKQLVSWYYLTQNRWKAFEPEAIVADDTNGLLRPGIIKLALPSDITSTNTQMPGGLCWIRASVTDFPDGVGKVYVIHAQAVKATFQNNENDLNRLATALAPESVNKLEFRDAAIKKVSQPFASFGGKVEESSNDFYVRVSERLRHKHRAISIFDYERLVLGQFPEVYQVKCISHTRPLVRSESTSDQLSAGLEYSPGEVRVIVLPDLRNQNAIDPLRPRVSKNTLVGISQFLAGLNSSFADLTVANPTFEEVTVSVSVALLPGKDAGFYLRQLNEDIIRYLSPWRFDDEFDLHFGAELHISPLINYLDGLGYIDYVEEVTLSLSLRDENDATVVLLSDQEEVSAQTSASVLISAPQHTLALIENTNRCLTPQS